VFGFLANRHNILWPSEASSFSENRQGDDWILILDRFQRCPGPKILIDCTADETLPKLYPSLLASNIPVVTPNKHAFSGSQSFYNRLNRPEGGFVRCHYETTVGAALPILSTIRALRESGDRVWKFEAALSGTWSFILHQLHQGLPFSQAVRRARDLGITEPHPQADLAGMDLHRKALILMREAGYQVEPGDVLLPRWIPGVTFKPGLDRELFLNDLVKQDPLWSTSILEARKRGEKLVLLIRFDVHRGAILGLVSLPAGNAFAELRPGENRLEIWTDRYCDIPLSIAGPGAGAEITAFGLFQELLRVASRVH
jgi:aspartokinase/homoserine dehydrogenase 1